MFLLCFSWQLDLPLDENPHTQIGRREQHRSTCGLDLLVLRQKQDTRDGQGPVLLQVAVQKEEVR